jgi:hypothetical protein
VQFGAISGSGNLTLGSSGSGERLIYQHSDVSGNYLRTYTAGYYSEIKTYGDNNLSIGTNAGNMLQLATSNTAKLTILSGGNVGIATASPGYTIDINGDIGYSGSVTPYSDERLKKNIAPITSALSIVKALQGVSFQWNSDMKKMSDSVSEAKTNYGMVAQAVELVVPELVSKTKKLKDPKVSLAKDAEGKEKELEEKDFISDVRGVDYIKMIPFIVEAIKELAAQVDATNARCAAIEARLEKLEKAKEIIK